jgi:hypothetical protein
MRFATMARNAVRMLQPVGVQSPMGMSNPAGLAAARMAMAAPAAPAIAVPPAPEIAVPRAQAAGLSANEAAIPQVGTMPVAPQIGASGPLGMPPPRRKQIMGVQMPPIERAY